MSDLERLRERIARATSPGIASTDRRRRYKTRARERFDELVAKSGRSQREFAGIILCDESAVRRARESGLSLPLPAWLEALIENDPDTALRYVASILESIEDVRRAS